MPQLTTDDGVALHYTTRGSGSVAVICLHFMGGCAANYNALAGALDEMLYQVVALDFRGHGESEAKPSEFTNQRLARDVVQLADAIGARRFALIGHSFGGKVALKVASLVPTRVAGLVLLGSVGPGPVPFEREAAAGILNRAQDLAFLVECFRGWFRTDGDVVVTAWAQQFKRTPVWAHEAVCEIAMWTDLSDHIRVIDTPALVVAGAHDPVYGLTYQREAVMPALANATLVTADCGHGMMVENVAEIAGLCRSFLGQLRTNR